MDSLVWWVGIFGFSWNRGVAVCAVLACCEIFPSGFSKANSSLEDQSQVFTSSSATYVGVYDVHGGPEASCFISRHLFPCIDSHSPCGDCRACLPLSMAYHTQASSFLELSLRESLRFKKK